MRNGRLYAVHRYCENGKEKILYMHRYVMDAPDDYEIDHRGDPLDNRIAKLRYTKNGEFNNRNKSKARTKTQSQYKGVYPCPNSKKNPWRARINCKGINYNSPPCKTELEAYQWYCAKAKELFGQWWHP
jgi:hypothetical protein